MPISIIIMIKDKFIEEMLIKKKNKEIALIILMERW